MTSLSEIFALSDNIAALPADSIARPIALEAFAAIKESKSGFYSDDKVDKVLSDLVLFIAKGLKAKSLSFDELSVLDALKSALIDVPLGK